MALTPDDVRWLALALVEGVGGARLKALSAHFGHVLADVLAAEAADLRAVPGIGPKMAAAITAIDVYTVAAQLERWAAAGVRAVPLIHPAYPLLLHTLPDPPAALFIRAACWPDERPPVELNRAAAIVGTRMPHRPAAEAAYATAAALVGEGVCVVSGLAYGIDAAAHRGALAGGAREGARLATVAVLGGGVLRVFPPNHAALADEVIAHGALVSECAPDARASTPGLVARNRIIAGLAGGLLVAQTDADGGAMHAARRALALGRRVAAFDPAAFADPAALDALEAAFSGSAALLASGGARFDPARADEPGYAADMLGV